MLITRLAHLWRNLFRRAAADRDLDDELRAYVELLTADYVRDGLSPELARQKALVDVGGVQVVKDATRDAWIGNALADFAREARYAIRSLCRAPAFVITAIATLALGIGGATAMFTAINGSLLRQLPGVADPSRLVNLEPIDGVQRFYDFSYPDVRDIREQTRTLSRLAGFDGGPMMVRDASGSRRHMISYVTGDFFTVLGARAAVGRVLGKDDENPAAASTIVLSDHLWRERYGGDSSIIGATLHLDGQPFIVVGIAMPEFVGAMLMHPMDAWISFTAMASRSGDQTMLMSRRDEWLRLVGRLAPGRSVADVQRELDVIAARIAQAHPEGKRRGVRVFARAGMIADEREALERIPRLLTAAVVLLLLIACANVANLSLVRAASRRRELATRVALGASRASLVGRFLIEGSVLACCGGVLGVAVAQLLVRSSAIMNTVAPMPGRVGIGEPLNLTVLGVTFGICALAAIIVSIGPSLHAIALPPGLLLKDGAAGAVRRRSIGLRALVVVQVSASLVLLTGAAVVFSTFRRTLAMDLGFDAHRLTSIRIASREAGYDSTRQVQLNRELLRHAELQPGIAHAALASVVPPAGWASTGWTFRGGEAPSPSIGVSNNPAGGVRSFSDVVSPDFFETMRIPIVAGRAFLPADDERAEPVVVVSRSLASQLWPGENAIGRLFSRAPLRGQARPPLRVVGVAGDTRHSLVTAEPKPTYYIPFAQAPQTNPVLVMRARDDTPLSAAWLKQLVADVDPAVSMMTLESPTERVAEQLQPQRVAGLWIGAFGVMALVLAAIGLLGVVAQGVLQRTRELAVRLALGATPTNLVELVIGEGMRLALLGVIVGGFAAIGAWRIIRSQVAGVALIDARGAVLAGGALLFVMLVASYLPARRASRLDPAATLRAD